VSKKTIWILMVWAAGAASCASSPKSAPPIRETTADVQAVEPVDATNTEDATQAPDGEISLDGAKTQEVDIGVTGTSTGPVVVDRAVIEDSAPATAVTPEMTPEMTPEELAESMLQQVKAAEAELAERKGNKKAGKKTDGKKVVEEPKSGQLIIESGDAAPSPVLVAP
jgi:hypothetical protein